MSTKVLARKQQVSAEPVTWRQVTGTFAYQAGEETRKSDSPLSPEISAVEKLLQETEELHAQLESLAAEAETRIKEAFEQGKQEGDAKARQELNAQLEIQLDALRRMTESLAGYAPQLRKQAEQELVRLAVAIARRILYRELRVDPDALLGLVKVALDKINLRELHEIRASEEDVPLVERALQKLEIDKRIKITGETQLVRGSLLFETNQGNLDASVETQLQEMQRGFADLLNRVPA